MRWFGPAMELQTVEASDHLLFRATKQRRRIDLIVPVLCGVGFIVALSLGRVLWTIGLAAFGGICLYCVLAVSTRELLVTQFDLTVNRSRYFWKDIRRLEYRAGGEDETSGLYARQGRWSSVCLMPHLNREQADAVIAAIYLRFPLVNMAQEEASLGAMFRDVVSKLHPDKKRKDGNNI